MARTLTSAPRAFAPAAAPDALVGLDEATAQEVRAVLALLPPARLGALEQPSELLFEAGGDFTLVRFCAAGLAVVEIASLRQPRPIGGWSFDVPEGWDAPLDDVAAYR